MTDHEYRILALLRSFSPSENVKYAVGEIYNVDTVLTDYKRVEMEELRTALRSAGPKDSLKKLLNVKFGN